MRSIRRTADTDTTPSPSPSSTSLPPPGGPLSGGLGRDIALVCLADALVGVSFGAIAVGTGFPIWLPMLLSVVVFAGASQFMFIAIIGAGGNPVAAVVAGLLVNARHLPFGLAIGDAVGGGLVRRVAGSHVMIDESTAFAMSQSDPRRRRAAFWTCGLALFVCWNAGVLVGAFGGTLIRSTDALGMDAAFPAVLLALLMPSLRDRATRTAGLIGAAIAVGTGLVLPAGLPVLLALVTLPLAVFAGGAGRRGGSGQLGESGQPGRFGRSDADPELLVTAEQEAAIADSGAGGRAGGSAGQPAGSAGQPAAGSPR